MLIACVHAVKDIHVALFASQLYEREKLETERLRKEVEKLQQEVKDRTYDLEKVKSKNESRSNDSRVSLALHTIFVVVIISLSKFRFLALPPSSPPSCHSLKILEYLGAIKTEVHALKVLLPLKSFTSSI